MNAFSLKQLDDFREVHRIFMPLAAERVKEAFNKEPTTRFVHYTSAEAALNIIRTKCIWMRSPKYMADFSEVKHGHQVIQHLRDQGRVRPWVNALDAIVPGIANNALAVFDQRFENLQSSCYIASLSEHQPDDCDGRLSMWRASGTATGKVAIVLKLPDPSGEPKGLNLLFSPVEYLDEEKICAAFEKAAGNIRSGYDLLHSYPEVFILNVAVLTLIAAVVSLKHPCFHEEREWRAVYIPTFWAALGVKSSPMKSSFEIIGSIPQQIYKIPLDETVRPSGLDLATIFERLIIGPTSCPTEMHDVFANALAEAGVTNAQDRIVSSRIPIRM
jgi:hypothetical protein